MQISTNEIFAKMLDWIFTNTDSKRNVDVAKMSGIDETTISRILNGRVKKTKQDTLRAINAAYGNVFNPEWLRGKSDVMLMADLVNQQPGIGTGRHQQAPMTVPDYPTMLGVNSLIAAKDEAYEALKGKLEAKEEVITELRGRLSDKDEIIRQKDILISKLENQILELNVEKGLYKPHGAAEPEPARRRP